nr:hypothetical protein [Tanacetum cinerariifolium]
IGHDSWLVKFLYKEIQIMAFADDYESSAWNINNQKRIVTQGMLTVEGRHTLATGDMQRRYITSCLGDPAADALVP